MAAVAALASDRALYHHVEQSLRDEAGIVLPGIVNSQSARCSEPRDERRAERHPRSALVAVLSYGNRRPPAVARSAIGASQR